MNGDSAINRVCWLCKPPAQNVEISTTIRQVLQQRSENIQSLQDTIFTKIKLIYYKDLAIFSSK